MKSLFGFELKCVSKRSEKLFISEMYLLLKSNEENIF